MSEQGGQGWGEAGHESTVGAFTGAFMPVGHSASYVWPSMQSLHAGAPASCRLAMCRKPPAPALPAPAG